MSDIANFCANCGARVRGNRRVCGVCGAEIVRLQLPTLYKTSPGSTPQASPGSTPQAQPQQQFQQERAFRQDAPARATPPGKKVLLPKPVKRKRRKKRVLIVIAAIVAVLVVAAAIAYFYLRSALATAPDMRDAPRGSGRVGAAEINQGFGGRSHARDTSKYTFLVLGADYGEYNTDVIMVVTFDAAAHTLDIVNIPRDTLVNVSWNLKKANSIVANMRARTRNEADSEAKAMQATVEAFADVLGFEVDYWVFVNIQAFVSLVDAVGGVDFYVPVNMNYDDRAGGLSIHYSQGMHHLRGQQALEVLRFRSGYASADIGRIGTQQEFLKSAAEQILEGASSVSVVRLAGVFFDNVRTDLKLDDLIWLGREVLGLGGDDINFHLMPGNASATIRSQSYVTIYVDEWLELVNEHFYPFRGEVGPGDVSILTRDSNGRLYATDGNRQGDASWGG